MSSEVVKWTNDLQQARTIDGDYDTRAMVQTFLEGRRRLASLQKDVGKIRRRLKAARKLPNYKDDYPHISKAEGGLKGLQRIMDKAFENERLKELGMLVDVLEDVDRADRVMNFWEPVRKEGQD